MGVPTETTTRAGRPAVAARFAALPDAREGIVALQRAGVDADDIQLLGDQAVDAGRPSSPSPVDRRTTRFVAGRVITGAALGAGIGAVAGVVAGLVLIAVADIASAAWAVVLCALVLGMLGAAVGAFVSVERGVGFGDAWPTTFESGADGEVWVAVYTRDRETANRATDVLSAATALELQSAAGRGRENR
jgi:hypothetical protein